MEEMRLDGNAAAGMMSDVFGRDMTTASATCAGCGATRAMGALLEYGHAMGVVLRCPDCDGAMLRIVSTPRELRMDGSGISLLVITVGRSPEPT
jgi:hypothetical protein